MRARRRRAMSGKTVERIGLLFVHGIGEQQRFEHLRDSVGEFAELMQQSGDPGEAFAASVTDRTGDWKLPPGEPDPQGTAPITLTLDSLTRRLVFDCYEVWWADLGARTGIADTLAFWFWGLGQWLAPIYRDLDAADLQKVDVSRDGKALNKPASKLVKLPEAVAGRIRPECVARLRLAMAALATLFVLVSWVVLKRLFAAVLRTAPSPTLLVSYVGDVRTYEERATPGDTAVSDPGQPRRVGIRRRMVTELVAMGARSNLDRWYVVAHSQGSVIAYNGLTEIGHALPNYLPQAQWDALPDRFKRDAGCDRRPDRELADMMPARPPWLVPEDVLNRPLLFAGLRGLLTYGSPLNKFAAIWPRIVATATDRRAGDPLKPFGDDCRWVNLRALQDPVAGDVTRFFEPRPDRPGFTDCIPPISNIETPFRPNVLLAHLRYFDVAERFAKRLAITQRQALMRWIMTTDAAAANLGLNAVEQPAGGGRAAVAALLYFAVLALLAVLAVATVTLGGNLSRALFGSVDLAWIKPAEFAWRMLGNVMPVLGVAGVILVGAGWGRWLTDAWRNMRLARTDGLPRIGVLMAAQLAAAIVTPVLVGAAALWLSAHDPLPKPPTVGFMLAAASTALVLAGVLAQAVVNRLVAQPLRYR